MEEDTYFLNLDFIIRGDTNSIDVDVDYDKRIIKDKEKLQQITEEYFCKIKDLIFKESEDK